MGWRGTLRSISAAARAAERDAERRRKQRHKTAIVSAAADAVSEWQETIDDLVSIHIDRAIVANWADVASRPAPLKPKRSADNENEARSKLDFFKPRKFDFLFGGSEKRYQKLVVAVDFAKEEDERIFLAAEKKYHSDLEEWKTDTDLARRLLSGEAEAIQIVIQEMQSLSRQSLIGTEIKFLVSENYVHAIARIHNIDIVPHFRRKQLSSGRLSEMSMPIGESNELYQDYVCSSTMRIAGDLLGILPINEIYVTCTPLILDKKSGYQRHTPILSAQIVRDTFDRLILERVDPSDAMTNFKHVMNFKRSRGFEEIEPLRPIGD